jgi:hypothetical protein
LREGGCVEDDRVEATGGVELVELGHGGELLRARHGAGKLLIDAIGENPFTCGRVGSEHPDEIVEGPLGVEHHRPQLATQLQSVTGEVAGLDHARLVTQLLEPQRASEPAGGVDRDDGDPLAARREPDGDGGGRGRLADPARTGADADALVGHPLSDAHRSSSRDRRSSAAESSADSNTNGSVTSGTSCSPRRSREICLRWWRAQVAANSAA